jgi:hypothetical protein
MQDGAAGIDQVWKGIGIREVRGLEPRAGQ